MKKFYLIVLSFFIIHFSFASTITATLNNGVWNNSNTWNKNRKPQNGDTILIPAGKTIIMNNWEVLNNVSIKIYGMLEFQNPFSGLALNSASVVSVFYGATIQATVNYLQYILIGNQIVFFKGNILGPQTASSSTGNGFMAFNPLPVKFVGFTVMSKNNDALIQWSTAQEMGASTYEVEKSLDGANWNTIAYVMAAGNSSNVNNYSFTDKNVTAQIAYYRIKEVDFDGSQMFSAIRSIKTEIALSSDIKIASVQNKVLLQFPAEVKGNVMVRFVSLSGQVVDQQNISNPVGQVVLNSRFTGNYIISVTNGQNVNTAKQVIL